MVGCIALVSGSAEAAPPSVVTWVQTATAGPAFARLRAAQAARQQADHRGVLTNLAEYSGALDHLAAVWRAEAQAALGETGAARTGLAASPPAPRACKLDFDAELEAHVALEARLEADADPKEAAARLLTLPAHGPRIVQAEAWLSAAGAKAEARAAEVRLLIEVPAQPEARARAAALGPAEVAKRLKTPEARLQRLRNLLDAHDNAEAAAEAQRLAKDLGPAHGLICELGYIEGKALRKLRQYRPAQRVLEAARKHCTKTKAEDFALRIALLEAQVRGIRGQVRGTEVLAEWIQKQSPGHAYADDALLMHAEVKQRRGDEAGARAAYGRLITLFPDGDFAPTARWRLALADLVAGRKVEAEAQLAQILSAPTARPSEHFRARYWRARLALDAGRLDAAQADFEALVLNPNFYGWMALDRLAGPKPKWVKGWKARLRTLSAAPNTPISVEDLGSAQDSLRRAAQLVGLDQPEWARSEIEGQACALKGTAGRRALATALDALGFHPEAQMHMRASQPGWRKGAVQAERVADWRLAYSRPYAPELNAAAQAEKLDVLFLTALSREESTFDPNIVSWAGATGLAQLMPATAIGAYADVFGGRLPMERLTEPALNLRLGARVLAQGLRGFRGVEPLALAAYNGGPGLARRFVPEAAMDFDLWVETLSVKETRRYVRRVTETWGIYHWLYDAKRPFVGLPKFVGGPDWPG